MIAELSFDKAFYLLKQHPESIIFRDKKRWKNCVIVYLTTRESKTTINGQEFKIDQDSNGTQLPYLGKALKDHSLILEYNPSSEDLFAEDWVYSE